MHPVQITFFPALIATMWPRAENITAGKVAKAALAIFLGVGNFCLFPWQIAAPLTLVTTYLIYKIDTMFTGMSRAHRRESPRVVISEPMRWDTQVPTLRFSSGRVTARETSPLLAPRFRPDNPYGLPIRREHEVVGGGHTSPPRTTLGFDNAAWPVPTRPSYSPDTRVIFRPSALAPDRSPVIEREAVGRGHTTSADEQMSRVQERMNDLSNPVVAQPFSTPSRTTEREMVGRGHTTLPTEAQAASADRRRQESAVMPSQRYRIEARPPITEREVVGSRKKT